MKIKSINGIKVEYDTEDLVIYCNGRNFVYLTIDGLTKLIADINKEREGKEASH